LKYWKKKKKEKKKDTHTFFLFFLLFAASLSSAPASLDAAVVTRGVMSSKGLMRTDTRSNRGASTYFDMCKYAHNTRDITHTIESRVFWGEIEVITNDLQACHLHRYQHHPCEAC
jgi:hypothetical protein